MQIQETSRLILSNFYNLTIPEIYLVINNAKMGFYGKLYDRIDGSIILSWFNSYFEERCNTYEQISFEESNIMRGKWNFKVYNNQKQ